MLLISLQNVKTTPSSLNGLISLQNVKTPPSNLSKEDLKEIYCIGRLVWGNTHSYRWWPAFICSYDFEEAGFINECDNSNVVSEASKADVGIKWFGKKQEKSLVRSFNVERLQNIIILP